MVLYFSALASMSYLIFVFISDLFNPFVVVKTAIRKSRWRLGWAAALCSLIAGTLAITIMLLYAVDQRTALVVYLVMASAFIIPSVIKYRKLAIWQ